MSLIQTLLKNDPITSYYEQMMKPRILVYSTLKYIQGASKKVKPGYPSFMKMPSQYSSDMFGNPVRLTDPKKIQVLSTELCKPGKLCYYLGKGMRFVRRRHVPFPNSLRNPILGCHLELFAYKEVDCIPLTSDEAFAMIHKISY